MKITNDESASLQSDRAAGASHTTTMGPPLFADPRQQVIGRLTYMLNHVPN